uniref:Uncharacterized protein n=1 Tax=Tanacetum cinerariifolium TaxID=118510 RepID=A0A6L2KT74_TANCI|nr:hypothetical protein [Tanacetum cinerariifolium]
MTTSVGNNSVFRSFFEKQKLTGPNFIDRYRQLYLQVPPAAAAAHVVWVKGQKEVVVLMLLTMDLDIQRNLAYLVSLFLVSLSKDYDSFVQNYNMHGMGKTVNELHAMLKLNEDTLPKKDANPALHAIRAGRVQKNQKNKPRKVAKGGHGHWRRNCPVYLVELMKKKKLSQGASTSGIFTIELYSFPSKSWIYDTGCGTHICITTQGLWGSKKLKPGALSLYVGDGHRAAVEAIRTYHLELPGGLVIVLNNCHYAPSITRGVILVSRLFDDGFINRFDENNVISVSKNNLVYFMAVSRDGIFEIDMSCTNTNDSSIKKRIEKLQHDGLLNSIDIESLEKCVSCMSGKMARKPDSHQVETNKDLLGLIHTDVFKNEVENQLGKTIKSLRSDRGERRNRTLLDMVRSMMSQTTLPKSFWDYALETTTRVLNMVPTKKGCEALVKRDTLTKPDKLDPRSFRCIFVGYPKETIGYSFYSPSENKVFVAQNAEFFENDLIDLKASWSVEDLELIQEENPNTSLDTSLDHEEVDQEIDEPQSEINPIRKFSRRCRTPDRMCLYIDAEEHELGDLGEPTNYKAALLDPKSKKWLDAMNVEMQSMKDNDVWVLVELPPNTRTVGSKWLFKKKNDMDGVVYVFKARLIAKGFTQTYGVDYEETFSPVADIRAIRILIAIATYYDYEIWQMDVKTAFLNGHLSEEVYMKQPKGFVNPNIPRVAEIPVGPMCPIIWLFSLPLDTLVSYGDWLVKVSYMDFHVDGSKSRVTNKFTWCKKGVLGRLEQLFLWVIRAVPTFVSTKRDVAQVITPCQSSMAKVRTYTHAIDMHDYLERLRRTTSCHKSYRLALIGQLVGYHRPTHTERHDAIEHGIEQRTRRR